MSESTKTLSKKQRKAQAKAVKEAETVSVHTPAALTTESLLSMSSGFSSPELTQSKTRSEEFQIGLLEKLDKDSVPLIELLNIVALKQVLYKHGKNLQDEVNSIVKVLAGEFQDPSHPILPSPSSSKIFPPPNLLSPLSELQTVVEHKFDEFWKHVSFRDCSFDRKTGQIKSWPSKNVLNDKMGKSVLRTIDTSQVIAHTMIPTLSSLEPKTNLIKFYEGCKTLKTSGLETPINLWLPKGNVRIQLYWVCRSEELVASESELDEILEDTESFFKLCEGLIRAWKLPKGDLTDASLVRQQIKLMLKNLSQDDIRHVCKVLGNFQADYPEIYQNVESVDQSTLVTASIETNLKAPNASMAQRVIFQFLKDSREPKITAIKQMFDILMLKINATRKSCNEAHAVGMRFPDEESTKPLNKDKLGVGTKP